MDTEKARETSQPRSRYRKKARLTNDPEMWTLLMVRYHACVQYMGRFMPMAKFTNNQIEELRQNPNVRMVCESKIVYTEEFKRKLWNGYAAGQFPREIFRKNGIDPEIIGDARVWCVINKLKKELDRHGDFCDARRAIAPERKAEITAEKRLQRAEHELEYLKQEVEFLKKTIISQREARRK